MISLSLPPPANLPPPPFLPPSSIKPVLNAKSLHDRLISFIDGGHLHKALSTLDLMARHGTHPDPVTYSRLLNFCIRSRSFQLGRRVHSRLAQSGLELDSVLHNSLISFYSKCGDLEQANAVFQTMGDKRDLISWSSMVSCFANNGEEREAICKFIDMLEIGFEPNEYCYAAVIRACANPDYVSIGVIVLGLLLKKGYFESDARVACALIDMFVRGSRDLGSAFKVFDKMTERNVIAWTLMISRCTELGFPREAIDLFLDMVLSGFEPDRFTMSAVVSACAELQSLSMGKQLHSWAVRTGLSSDACVGCSFVDMYLKCAVSVEDSRKFFDRMPEHNVMSWTAIINGYGESTGVDMEVVRLFYEMICGCVLPNHLTLAGVLKACGSDSGPLIGQQVYAYAVKRGFTSDHCVLSSLISMLVRFNRMDDARKAFESLFKNSNSNNPMLDGYSRTLSYEEDSELLHKIEDGRTEVGTFTFASILSGAASIGAISSGERIHAQVVKSGFGSDLLVCNALISMYSKCGNIDAANKVFVRNENANVISWTSMITGFAKHGFAIKALEMFREMLEANVKPNEVTYIAILSACSHVGLVSEGQRHFRSMYEEHAIVPRMEHYACMVDLFSRSGSLKKALEFIDSMPLKPNALVWRTFLGACRVHGDTELGKHAAMMILDQNPNDRAAYVLLSNLYAASGQWDRVAEIRKHMKEQNLVKEAGCSWIEIEAKVHKFYVGDTSHLQAQEIYNELDQLVTKIKRLGYVPNTDFVLQELEDDELKEQFLLQHSEKIAVTYGLIRTSASKPIHVFKNLRVCGDCHEAIKYISMATGREIILRDSNRFHHIKDGKCSCSDYW